jgi:hypothetical protein
MCLIYDWVDGKNEGERGRPGTLIKVIPLL